MKITVREADSIIVPMGASVFYCTFYQDRWTIHESKDDELKGITMLPSALLQVLNGWLQQRMERDADASGDVGGQA